MRKVCLSASLLTLVFATSSFARDPSGEKAFYKLDRSRARTSAMVKSGQLEISVANRVGDAYPTTIDYEFSVLLGGDYKGKEVSNVHEAYFTPAFMERLRAEKEIITDSYKVKYLGRGDARTLKGRVYSQCDKVLIYDLDVEKQQELSELIRAVLVPAISAQHAELLETKGVQVEDAKLLVHVHVDVPALGLVKVDMEGIVQGLRGKAGFDYDH